MTGALALYDEIVQRVIEIRQEKRIKLPDAIIAATAATAIEYNSLLVTRNIADFKSLNLETYNPFDKNKCLSLTRHVFYD